MLLPMQLISTERFGKCILMNYQDWWKKEMMIIMDPLLFVIQSACRYGCHTLQTHYSTSVIWISSSLFFVFFRQNTSSPSSTQLLYCEILLLLLQILSLKKYHMLANKVKVVSATTRFFYCHNLVRCHCCSTELTVTGAILVIILCSLYYRAGPLKESVRDVISPHTGSPDRDRISGSARSETRPDRGRLPFVAVGPPRAASYKRGAKPGHGNQRSPCPQRRHKP
jgi:hypothetical protein